MSLTLLQPPPCPVVAGDTVHVPEPVSMSSGRWVPRGDYLVEAVEDTPSEHSARGRYRLVVTARPDCRGLPRRFHRPSLQALQNGAVVPFSAEPKRIYLYPGDFTRYAEADPIPDAHVQTS